MTDLNGKVALVTGGSRGIGRAIAVALARSGADVAVNFVHNENAAQECVDDIQHLGRQAIAIQADVGYINQTKNLVKTVSDHFGHLDSFVGADLEEIEDIREIGPKIAQSVVDFFFVKHNLCFPF